MTRGADSSGLDRGLERAWRAHSREAPPPELDRAILAAAHRAAGSGPRDASKAMPEATRPQRWWMPLAAAATIGVIAFGIVQLTPWEDSLDAADEREGNVATARPAAPAAEPQPPGAATTTVEERAAERKDVVGERQRLALSMDKVAASALAGNEAIEQAKRDAPPPPIPGRKAASLDDLRAHARDPDAWIVRIRKLRDAGDTAEALRELREFRNLVPDAERRLPADLLAWADTVKS